MTSNPIPNPITHEQVKKQGVPVLFDGCEGWIYRPDPTQDEAYIWHESWDAGTQTPEKVSWQREWRRRSIALQYQPDFAEQLGLNESELPTKGYRAYNWGVMCPFCGGEFVNRFESRIPLRQCPGCKGYGDRAMMATALVDHWVEEIRETRDLERAKRLQEALKAGFYRSELFVIIRDLEGTAENETTP